MYNDIPTNGSPGRVMAGTNGVDLANAGDRAGSGDEMEKARHRLIGSAIHRSGSQLGVIAPGYL